MTVDVLGFQQVDRTMVALVGGKGANLGELARIDGLAVPAGFCVTTQAFARFMAAVPSIDARRDQLARLRPDERDAIRALSADLRSTLEAAVIPDDVAAAITRALADLGGHAFAVRSSTTAEDSATASFAGQQDSYLNVAAAAVLDHVRRCWASLFTERAVTYRLRSGVDAPGMGVVVQQMVSPRAAGVLFTADPLTGHRKVSSIEASLGLGEALVAGRINADRYQVRDGAIVASSDDARLLSDDEALRLVAIGRRIEAHFGAPQDIEWCLDDDGIHIVQSRPITTLFPIPEVGDDAPHVYVSVGHQQMMTDAMKPLGLSVFQLSALRPMFHGGGRLFVDIARGLASPASRAGLLAVLGKGDPLIRDALESLLARGDFIHSLPDPVAGAAPVGVAPALLAPAPIATDARIVSELIAMGQASIAALQRDIQGHTGPALIDFIRADLQELKRLLSEPQSVQVIMAGMQAAWWLNDHIQAWLGETNVADTLTQSVPGNVTSEMGLALLDVADVIRPHQDVVSFLQRVDGDDVLDALPALAGGAEARAAIQAFLDRYGMRCVGEIDITRPRWRERPSALVPMLLSHISRFAPGESARHFARGEQQARLKAQDVLTRVRALHGDTQAEEVARMIDRVRTFSGYREYPKYAMISRYAVYRQALWREAAGLVAAHVLADIEDIGFLTFDELDSVVRTHRVDDSLVRARRDAFEAYRALTPPRVLTSDGECIAGAYRRDDVPSGALTGLAVSAGVVEGRARVILDIAEAELEPGDILVTTFTDPSWTPLFVGLAGLVTEVGGLTTHGAVIAREYGVPAVVGVAQATRRIRDGQRIRVHGTSGWVELLDA